MLPWGTTHVLWRLLQQDWHQLENKLVDSLVPFHIEICRVRVQMIPVQDLSSMARREVSLQPLQFASNMHPIRSNRISRG